jgi:type I restriction enzyme S subunit
MDDLIAAQTEKVAALKENKTGLMQQLFPQKGETTPRLRFPEFTGEWVEKKLSEITERVSVGLATSVTPYYRDKGVVMFRNLNIKPDFLDDSDILYLDETFANANPAKKIHTDDVLTVHTGYVGISCVVPPKYDGALTFTTLVTTTKEADLNPRFSSSFLNSNEGAQRITVLQAGCGRNNLNVNDFILLQVPLPPTIGEQQKIADCLSELDTLIASETKQLEALKDHKKGLMQQLFPQPAK